MSQDTFEFTFLTLWFYYTNKDLLVWFSFLEIGELLIYVFFIRRELIYIYKYTYSIYILKMQERVERCTRKNELRNFSMDF